MLTWPHMHMPTPCSKVAVPIGLAYRLHHQAAKTADHGILSKLGEVSVEELLQALSAAVPDGNRQLLHLLQKLHILGREVDAGAMSANAKSWLGCVGIGCVWVPSRWPSSCVILQHICSVSISALWQH